MVDYSQKGNDFAARMKQGVPKDACKKGLESWKASQNAKTQKKSASADEQRVRARGGITRG